MRFIYEMNFMLTTIDEIQASGSRTVWLVCPNPLPPFGWYSVGVYNTRMLFVVLFILFSTPKSGCQRRTMFVWWVV